MATERLLHSKFRTRLIKSAGAKRRRQKVQSKRLIALGVPAAKVKRMDSSAIRTMLKRPALIKKA
jgi:hypothetical protein